MKKEHRRGIPIPGRILTAGILIILQIALFAAVALSISHWLSFVYRIIQFLSMIMVIWIINKRDNPSYKFTWVLFILLAPCVGGVLFFLWGNGKVRPHLKKAHGCRTQKKPRNFKAGCFGFCRPEGQRCEPFPSVAVSVQGIGLPGV